MEITNTLGRRKSAVARIYLKAGSGQIVINGRDYKEYFVLPTLQYIVTQPFELANLQNQFDVKVNLNGGGLTGQAEALRLAISRALVELNPELRPTLKEKGLLRRDPRMVERKKPGQPGARKRFQFSKR
ncbi:MAG TPA: 30S ribosomal protein S9 [Bacteroidales bacterium]|jgi:small subunit ribosomal protein S9|nr:30S ribosomal protein S9 [Bacteroidales bacterium]HHT53014.1 30S ribosomal protein S9 [Bacteroidales bacterium]HNY62156.1 30S ribosomal protein S9 [Bacteroidales bacterium]HOH21721.1 30S ribosomal protein S9 [Bacteroidales bacterium]HPZ02860.1 30S ribosomal protein S9 [Bacteroidales bacterium]